MHSRLRLLAFALTTSVAALASVASLAAQAAPDYCPSDGAIRFGVEPYEAPQILLPAYQKIGELLSQKVGCPVKIQITSSYTAEIEAMRHDQLDVGEFGPLGAVMAAKIAGARIVAQFGDGHGKAVTYWASIVTWPGSGITRLAQIKGKTFVYSDPASTSGHLFPAYALKQAGIDPDHGIRAFYAGTHTNSFEALRHHKGQAGEFNSETLTLAKQRGWMDDAHFKTLWKSQPLPLDAVAINPRINPALAHKLTDALQHLSFAGQLDASGRKVMASKAELVPADAHDYAFIRQVMQKMHIGLSDL